MRWYSAENLKKNQILKYGLRAAQPDMGSPFPYLLVLCVCACINGGSRILCSCSMILLILLIMNSSLYISLLASLQKLQLFMPIFSYILKSVCFLPRGPWHWLKLQPAHTGTAPDHKRHSIHHVVQYAVDSCAYVQMYLL